MAPIRAGHRKKNENAANNHLREHLPALDLAGTNMLYYRPSRKQDVSNMSG